MYSPYSHSHSRSKSSSNSHVDYFNTNEYVAQYHQQRGHSASNPETYSSELGELEPVLQVPNYSANNDNSSDPHINLSINTKLSSTTSGLAIRPEDADTSTVGIEKSMKDLSYDENQDNCIKFSPESVNSNSSMSFHFSASPSNTLALQSPANFIFPDQSLTDNTAQLGQGFNNRLLFLSNFADDYGSQEAHDAVSSPSTPHIIDRNGRRQNPLF